MCIGPIVREIMHEQIPPCSQCGQFDIKTMWPTSAIKSVVLINSSSAWSNVMQIIRGTCIRTLQVSIIRPHPCRECTMQTIMRTPTWWTFSWWRQVETWHNLVKICVWSWETRHNSTTDPWTYTFRAPQCPWSKGGRTMRQAAPTSETPVWRTKYPLPTAQ